MLPQISWQAVKMNYGYTGGGAGSASSTGQLKVQSKDNGHGQPITMYRLVQ